MYKTFFVCNLRHPDIIVKGEIYEFSLGERFGKTDLN